MKQIILGVDPGYARVGWGVVTLENNKALCLAADCIETHAKEEYNSRLFTVYQELQKLILQYKPDVLAVESLFFNTNAKTAILASQARGVIVLTGVEKGLPVFDYTPLQVKHTLVGYGRGDKKQVQAMLKFHLGLTELPKLDDACDALAIALTHAYTNQRLK